MKSHGAYVFSDCLLVHFAAAEGESTNAPSLQGSDGLDQTHVAGAAHLGFVE